MQEWIWPIGYFLRAKLYYAKALEPKKKGLLKSTISFIKTRLTSHYAHVMDSPWQSLPELTNSNGQVSTVCLVWYSVDIQIKFWCIASILEVCWNATYFVYVFTAI